MRIEIKYDDRDVRKALERLRKAGADLEPAMREIAGHLADGVAESFARQESPDGKRWAPLTPATKKERRKKRYRAGPILERSGDLQSRIVADHDATTAVAGTNLVYARTHQFGARRGQFRGGKRPIPWGDVPARPFLGVSDETRDVVLDVIRDHLRRAVTG